MSHAESVSYPRSPWIATLLGAATMTLAVSACAAPDRVHEANELRTRITTMPGVRSFDPGYVNDFENGADLYVDVGMPAATDDEIAAVAARINDIKGNDFHDYRQTASFYVGDYATVSRSAVLDPGAIVADTEAVRTLRRTIPDGSLELHRDDRESRLQINDVAHTDAALRSAAGLLSGQSGVVVDIRSANSDEASSWSVTLPLTPTAREAIVTLRNSLRAAVFYTAVADDRISELDITVPRPTAYRDVVAVVSAVAPDARHP